MPGLYLEPKPCSASVSESLSEAPDSTRMTESSYFERGWYIVKETLQALLYDVGRISFT